MTDGLCQALHQFTAIATVVVFKTDAGNSIVFSDKNSDGELWYIILFQVLQFQLRVQTFVVVDDAHLIGKHNFCGETIVIGNLGKGIVFMAECLTEILTRLANEFHDTLRAYLTAERKGVDEHSHRVGNAHVAASVADCCHTQAVTIGET